uniref:Str_synth domain-containing protein n=1 Tax=Echinostoma caproni TaxID=27848 RepID=A0A183BD18_9TREM
LTVSSSIASVLDDQKLSPDSKPRQSHSSVVQRRPSVLYEMAIMRRHLVTSREHTSTRTSSQTITTSTLVSRSVSRTGTTVPNVNRSNKSSTVAVMKPLPNMANVLRPVVRKPKQDNTLWYIFGVIEASVLGVLFWLFFTGEVDPVSFKLTAVKEVPASAVQNARLSDISQINIGPHYGAESIVYVNGTLYTGTADGKILRITDSKVQVVHDMRSAACGSLSCGRPLGMRLSQDHKSIVFVDAFQGIFSFSLENEKVVKLFPVGDGFEPVFLNDLEVLSNGNIFVSETSVKYSLEQILGELMESRPNGRLLLVDPTNGRWRLFADGLHFPNGVQLHRDGKSVLVAETTRARVVRIPLDGRSPSTVFVDGLPGFPDNIRLSPRGGYWIPVSNVRNGSLFSWATEFSSNWPVIRQFAHRVSPYGSVCIKLYTLKRLTAV